MDPLADTEDPDNLIPPFIFAAEDSANPLVLFSAVDFVMHWIPNPNPPTHISQWLLDDVALDEWQYDVTNAYASKLMKISPLSDSMMKYEAIMAAWEVLTDCARLGVAQTRRFWCWSYNIFDPNLDIDTTTHFEKINGPPTGYLSLLSYFTPASSPPEPDSPDFQVGRQSPFSPPI